MNIDLDIRSGSTQVDQLTKIEEQLQGNCFVGPQHHKPAKLPAWRGVMIDSARTFYPLETLKLVVILMERYGFNKLHWHLTDDQGWRFEVPQYPLLTQVSAQRERMSFSHYTNISGDSVSRCKAQEAQRWRNGYYKDGEIRELVGFAADRGIDIVPELDLPGHMAAAIFAYPELGAPAHIETNQVEEIEGTLHTDNDLLWPTPQALEFLQVCLSRVVELFPSELIHIGGDECAWARWENDPQLSSFMRENQISHGRDMQRWFTAKAAAFLADQGRRVAGWDELAQLDINRKDIACLFAWDGEKGVKRAVQADLPFVYADSRYLYFNRVDPESSYPQTGMTPPLTCRDVFDTPWEMLASENCIGVQALVWSEFVLDEADLFAQLFPRLLIVADCMATALSNKKAAWEDLQERVSREIQVLRDLGLPVPLGFTFRR